LATTTADRLATAAIQAKQIRQAADTRRGYIRADFIDAFHRYRPADPKMPETSQWPRGVSHSKRAAALRNWFGSRTAHKSRAPSNVSGVSGANDEDRGGKER
jgi:hypothetical protein